MSKAALIIGVGAGDPRLPGAVEDARLLARILGKRRTDVLSDWDVELVDADDFKNYQATKESLDKMLADWLSQNGDPYADLLFFFAGHAARDSPNRDPDGLPIAARTFPDQEVWLLATDRPWLTLSELSERFAHTRARSVTLILDCCYSGTVVEHLSPLLQAIETCWVFSSCGKEQESYSWGEGFGYYSGVLNSALGGALWGDVSTSDLAHFVSTAWRNESPGTREGQSPVTLMQGPPVHLITVSSRKVEPEPIAHRIATLGDDLQASQEGEAFSLSWTGPTAGVGQLAGRVVPLRSGESVLAASRAEPTDFFAVAVGPEGTRLLRVCADGGLRQAQLDVGRVVSARFGNGLEYGALTLTTAGGRQHSIAVWKCAFEDVT